MAKGGSGTRSRSNNTFGKAAPVVLVGSLITPLNAGKHAYVQDVDAKNRHVATNSQAFVDVLSRLVAVGQAAKIRKELETLAVKFPNDGWGFTLNRVVADGVDI